LPSLRAIGRNWASRPQQFRGSFNRRAFAATANWL
jgi:hypothetical protein